MVKGGFQGLDISGVDLTAQSPTLPGAYAACAGADGKPIRVQTADGQVECSVKKVSTNYVLAGITGERKILSITISSTDGISVSESTIPSGEEPDYKTGSSVNLRAYTKADTKYTAPHDGIVSIRVNVGKTLADIVKVFMYFAGTVVYWPIVELPAGTAGLFVTSTFVKKGTKFFSAFASEDTEEVVSITYEPYVVNQ